MITFLVLQVSRDFLKISLSLNSKDIKLACFGAATIQLLKELGRTPDIEVPLPNVPSMVDALELYLKGLSIIDEPIARS